MRVLDLLAKCYTKQTFTNRKHNLFLKSGFQILDKREIRSLSALFSFDPVSNMDIYLPAEVKEPSKTASCWF